MVLRPGHGGFAVAGERRALMLTPLRQRKVARGVFDESHGEAWSIRPDTAAALRPEHPAAASYAAAAAALAARDFEVATHTGGSLAGGVLDAADVLVIAHPSAPRWERTAGGSPAVAAAWCAGRPSRTSAAPASTNCWRASAAVLRMRQSSTTATPATCPRGWPPNRLPAPAPRRVRR